MLLRLFDQLDQVVAAAAAAAGGNACPVTDGASLDPDELYEAAAKRGVGLPDGPGRRGSSPGSDRERFL